MNICVFCKSASACRLNSFSQDMFSNGCYCSHKQRPSLGRGVNSLPSLLTPSPFHAFFLKRFSRSPRTICPFDESKLRPEECSPGNTQLVSLCQRRGRRVSRFIKNILNYHFYKRNPKALCKGQWNIRIWLWGVRGNDLYILNIIGEITYGPSCPGFFIVICVFHSVTKMNLA